MTIRAEILEWVSIINPNTYIFLVTFSSYYNYKSVIKISKKYFHSDRGEKKIEAT